MTVPVRMTPLTKEEQQAQYEAFQKAQQAAEGKRQKELQALKDRMNAPRDALLNFAVDAAAAALVVGAGPATRVAAAGVVKPVTESIKGAAKQAFDQHAAIPSPSASWRPPQDETD